MDAERALSGCSETQPVILLVHQPNGASKILRSTNKRIDLILSGMYRKKGKKISFVTIFSVYFRSHLSFVKFGCNIAQLAIDICDIRLRRFWQNFRQQS